MIPVSLRLSGFLSYRDPVELDFSGFDLACISGANGAGKSSLLDAITWSLFGQARKRDESLVNLQSEAAEVVFKFSYENNLYRIQRTLPRGKSTVLEFQVQNGESWRPLTERTLRETQARIEQILRLDYETFVNAAFFLQGKADHFTQQTASKRKEVLGNILGLETWEIYKERTAERRKELEREVENIDGRVAEIEAELVEEAQRKSRLKELEKELKRLATTRKTQETALESMKKEVASLDNQRKLVERLDTALERSGTNLGELEARLSEREAERATFADLLERAQEVESAFKRWQAARADLERWEGIAAQFREHEKRRQPLLEAIAAERARLEAEQAALENQGQAFTEQRSALDEVKTQIEAVEKQLAETESRLGQRDESRVKLDATREQVAGMRAENEALKLQMVALDERIKKLEVLEGAACPLCGQPLTDEHRRSTLAQMQVEGKQMGDQWRTNKSRVEELVQEVKALEKQVAALAGVDDERVARSGLLSQLQERLETLQSATSEWQNEGAKRLKQVGMALKKKNYAEQAQTQLTTVDAELKQLGYDAAAHDAARQAESEGRTADEEHRELEASRAALAPLEREIKDLTAQVSRLGEELARQQKEYAEAAAVLAAAESQAPDLESAEHDLFDLQEQENRLNQEVGAARQKVAVLDDLRARRADYETQRKTYTRQISQHKTLERAFGKDGVPALLIEQALPQIESKANELLDRLSNGAMSIRFVTQAEYKDKKRDDLKETLEIQISDGAGMRDYEMYSGGEAFRVNFAIRLALSEVLAQRKGARLQTLVIDEGFGSQDAQGRQRLIEAINLVKGDFAKILVITHLDELKDAFPTRIEVEKTERGSVVRVS
jgi:exonuclease SbcC